MFSFVKRLFIGLLSFSSSIARDRTKFTSLNHEPCMVNPALILLNLVELKYHLFKISLVCLISKNMYSKRNNRHKY